MTAKKIADFYDEMDFDGWSSLDIAEAGWNAAKAAELLKISHDSSKDEILRCIMFLDNYLSVGNIDMARKWCNEVRAILLSLV